MRYPPTSKNAQDERAKVGRTGHLDFRVAADDDGVAVMPVMAPAPDHGFAHHHERGDLIQRGVHPVGLECRAVPALVPSRIRTRAVEHGIDKIRNHHPPSAPERNRGVAGCQQQNQQERGVADGRPVAALQELAHFRLRDGGGVPLGLGEALFHRARRVGAGETVIGSYGLAHRVIEFRIFARSRSSRKCFPRACRPGRCGRNSK